MSKYFHYTSLNILYSIVSNQELWFANLKNSNDPNELYLTCDDYNRYVKELNVDPYHGTPIILEENRIMGCPYGISFTALEDDLSQWERYGDNRSGVCILFDIDFLQTYLSENYLFTFYFESMKYTEEEKNKLINENIARMPKYNDYRRETHWPYCALLYLIHYSEARALFKSEAFKKEEEYRFFLIQKSIIFIMIQFAFFEVKILKILKKLITIIKILCIF